MRATDHERVPQDAILNSLREGIVVTAPDGSMIQWNDAAAAMLGLDPGAGPPVPRVDPDRVVIGLDGQPVDPARFPVSQVYSTGEPAEATLGISTREGVRWLHVSSSPLERAADGRPTLAVTTMIDVSSRREAEAALDAAERRIAEMVAMAETAPIGIFGTDGNGNCTYVNPRWRKIFGLRPDQAHGHGWLERVHPADRRRVEQECLAALRAAGPAHFEFRVTHADGTIHSVSASLLPIRGASGEVEAFAGTVDDVTAEIAADALAERAHHRYEAAFENAPIAMLELDGAGRVLAANAAVDAIFDAPGSALIGCAVTDLLGLDDIARIVEDPRDGESTHILSTPEGDRHLTLRVVALDPDATEGAAWLLQVADVTARKRLEDELHRLAVHDPLTGLLNRRSFGDALDEFVSAEHPDTDHGVLIVLDLDNFKAINDTSGHGAGDQAIVTVADALRHRLRERDLICRLGGDEFAILAPDCRREHAEDLARAAIEAVRECTVKLRSGETRRLGASAGVVPWNPGHRSADAMLADADKALYEAKDRGRDTVVVFDAIEEPRRSNSPLSWIDRIESALDGGEFELDAQPIMDLFDGTISQYELLIRMIGPDGSRIPPGPWMPVAERVGLFHRIDRWVCDQAIDLLARYDHVLEVNLSGRSLGNANLLEAIANRLEAEDVDPGRLIFEVTETGAVTNLTEAQGFLGELRSLGCRFALDDFGAGFGSFYYLKHLPFDFVKIDGEFVRACDTDAADRSVIRSVVDIATELGAQVVAEHVETTEVLHTIVSLGVRYGQGYLLGAPSPVITTFGDTERSRTPVATDPG